MTTVTYLTLLECENGHRRAHAHEGEWIPADQEAPWPDVKYCPKCRVQYSEDFSVELVEVREVVAIGHPEIDPEERSDPDGKSN